MLTKPRNILHSGQVSGMDIKDWIWFHIHNSTKYTELAKSSGKYFNLLDDAQYKVTVDGFNALSVEPVKMIV